MSSKKSKKYSFRIIKPADLEAVAGIDEEAFSGSSSADGISSRLQSVDKHCLVALRKEKVVGFIFFDIEDKQTMYVANVAVHKDHRGRGICAPMLKWLLKRLPDYGCKKAYLYVSASNTAGQRCYKSVGFKMKDEGGMETLVYKPRKRK